MQLEYTLSICLILINALIHSYSLFKFVSTISLSHASQEFLYLLQQVGLNISTGKFARGSEMDTDELTETGTGNGNQKCNGMYTRFYEERRPGQDNHSRVVITRGLGVTKRLEDRISLDNLIFKGHFLGVRSLARRGNVGEIGNNLLGVFCLSGTRFWK